MSEALATSLSSLHGSATRALTTPSRTTLRPLGTSPRARGSLLGSACRQGWAPSARMQQGHLCSARASGRRSRHFCSCKEKETDLLTLAA